jgi:hypothetical protein
MIIKIVWNVFFIGVMHECCASKTLKRNSFIKIKFSFSQTLIYLESFFFSQRNFILVHALFQKCFNTTFMCKHLEPMTKYFTQFLVGIRTLSLLHLMIFVCSSWYWILCFTMCKSPGVGYIRKVWGWTQLPPSPMPTYFGNAPTPCGFTLHISHFRQILCFLTATLKNHNKCHWPWWL